MTPGVDVWRRRHYFYGGGGVPPEPTYHAQRFTLEMWLTDPALGGTPTWASWAKDGDAIWSGDMIPTTLPTYRPMFSWLTSNPTRFPRNDGGITLKNLLWGPNADASGDYSDPLTDASGLTSTGGGPDYVYAIDGGLGTNGYGMSADIIYPTPEVLVAEHARDLGVMSVKVEKIAISDNGDVYEDPMFLFGAVDDSDALFLAAGLAQAPGVGTAVPARVARTPSLSGGGVAGLPVIADFTFGPCWFVLRVTVANY